MEPELAEYIMAI